MRSKSLVPRERSWHVVSNIIWGKRDYFGPLPPNWPSLSFIALPFLLSQPLGSPCFSLNKCYRNAYTEVKKIQSLLFWNDCWFTVFLVLNLAVRSGHDQTLLGDMDRPFLRSQRDSRVGDEPASYIHFAHWTCGALQIRVFASLYFSSTHTRTTSRNLLRALCQMLSEERGAYGRFLVFPLHNAQLSVTSHFTLRLTARHWLDLRHCRPNFTSTVGHHCTGEASFFNEMHAYLFAGA